MKYLVNVVLISMLLIVTAPMLLGCKNKPHVENISFASGIDNENKPTGISDQFLMNQKAIYCFVSISGIQKNTNIGINWYLIEGDLPINDEILLAYQEMTIPDSGTIPFGLFQQDDSCFPSGIYRVDIIINNIVFGSSTFTISYPSTPIIDIVHSETGNYTGDIHVSQSWVIFDIPFSLEMNIPESLLNLYQTKTRIFTSSPLIYSLYVSHPDDDLYISHIADAIKAMAQKAGFTSIQYVKSIIKFVRSITYVTDIESYGFDDYPKYPIETIVDGKGDCEDTAILLASLLKAGGMKPVLLLTKPGVDPGHCAIGISGEMDKDTPYYELDGTKYYYVESTHQDLPIGTILKPFSFDDFMIVPIEPLPGITYSIDDFRMGRVYRIRAYVKNIGSIKVDNVQIVANILSPSKDLITSQESESFSLDLDQESIVTFFLPYYTSGDYDLNVFGLINGESGYILEASLNCP